MSTQPRSFSLSGSMAGLQFNGMIRRVGATETNGDQSLAAGAAGTLTARTDDDTGTVTLAAGHAETTGSFDVFWTAPTPGLRRGMTGTLAGDALTLEAGAGDPLPPADTPVVADKAEVIDFDSLDTTIIMAAVSQERRASVVFQEEAGAAILALDLGRSGYDGEPWLWADQGPTANPFGAVISKVAVSNGSSAGTNLVQVAVLRS